MTHCDPISDLITRIRNGQKARLKTISAQSSKHVLAILDTLVREGYIRGYNTAETRPGVSVVYVDLKYYRDTPSIKMIARMSKPSRRLYAPCQDIPRIRNGLGTTVLSTSAGVLSGREARKAGIGGEILLKVF